MKRFAFVLAIFGGLHVYLWHRLVYATDLPAALRFGLGVLVALLCCAAPARVALSRQLPGWLSEVLIWPSYLWLGFAFYWFFAALAGDLVGLALIFSGDDVHAAWQGRRPWVCLGVGGAFGAFALWRARMTLATPLVEVTLRRLPMALDGLKIAQLSDVHIGPTLKEAFLRKVVATVNALEPDVVVITGDLVDAPVTEIGALLRPLQDLRATHGVYFVTGNHEYYAGARQWCEHLAALGVVVLRNERVSIGRGDASFELAGIEDFSAHHYLEGHRADLSKALEGCSESREVVLLAHQPRAALEAARRGVGLQLSGHTHGGQIWPFHYLVRLQQPFNAGLHRVGDTQVYVSRGTGYWGPPMRLGAPPEIAQVVLRAAGVGPAPGLAAAGPRQASLAAGAPS